MTLTYISNQGFAGGFDVGVTQAGLRLIHKTELKGGFGLPNCLANQHILGSGWTYDVGSSEAWRAPYADVVIGNPPCSGWSVMSAKSFRGADSPIMACTWAFVEYVSRVRPRIAVFESVQQAFTMTTGIALMRELRAYLEHATGESWTLHHVLHNAYSVGGAAQRKRYFWVVSRVPFGVEKLELSHLPTLNDVIGDLADLNYEWESQPYVAPAHAWAEPQRSPSGNVDGHVWLNRSPLTKRILDLMSTTAWNPGESIATVARRHYDTHGRLPESFSATESKIIEKDFRMGFNTPTRWNGDKAARVITGGALQLVIHPTRDRMITHREAARIMGFPDDWLISPLRGNGNLGMTWGKGITAQCGRWIGEWIKNSINENPGSLRGDMIGDREYVIDVTHAWSRTSKTVHSRISHVPITINIDGAKRLSPITTMRRTMTDENTVTESTVATDQDTSNATSRRGRPRPQSTIDRDNAVYEKLVPGAKLTRGQLAEQTGLSENAVFLSLYRLRNEGRVSKGRDGGVHVWYRDTDDNTEASAE